MIKGKLRERKEPVGFGNAVKAAMYSGNYFFRFMLKLVPQTEAIQYLAGKRAHLAVAEHVGGEGALHGLRVKLSDAHGGCTAGKKYDTNQQACNKGVANSILL